MELRKIKLSMLGIKRQTLMIFKFQYLKKKNASTQLFAFAKRKYRTIN